MAFDMSSAVPVTTGKFDIASAVPVQNYGPPQNPTPFESAIDPSNVVPAAIGMVGKGIGAAANWLTPDLVNSVNSGMTAAGKLPTFDGGTIGQEIPQEAGRISGAVNKFGQDNPAAGVVLDSLKNTAKLLPVLLPPEGAIERAGTDAMKAMADRKAAEALSRVPFDDEGKVSPHLFSEADKAFTDAHTSGVGRTTGAVQDFINQAFGSNADPAQVNGFLNKTLGDSPLKKSLLDAKGAGAFKDFVNSPMTLGDAQDLDQGLRTEIQKAYNRNSQSYDPDLGASLKNVRQSLRDNIYNHPDSSTLTGDNPAGFHSLQEGNRLFSMGKKAEDVENRIQTGMSRQVQSTGVQSQMSLLAKKIRESGPGQMGFKPNEVDAINNAAKSGVVTPFLKAMGSRLVTPLVVAGMGVAGAGSLGLGMAGEIMGGLAGEAGGYVAGAPFRAGATALQKGRATNVLREISQDPYYNPTPPSAAPKAAPLQITDRGDAARSADAQARARANLEAGKTGGATLPPQPFTVEGKTYSPPNKTLALPAPGRGVMTTEELAILRAKLKAQAGQTGGVKVSSPMESYQTGNATNAPKSPAGSLQGRLLTGPKTEMAGDTKGNIAPVSSSDAARAQAGRQSRASVSLTPDVQRVVSLAEVRQRFGPAFKQLDQETQRRVADQVNAMWAANKKAPLSDIITQARQNVRDLAAAKGQPTGTMFEAMSKAMPMKGRKK